MPGSTKIYPLPWKGEILADVEKNGAPLVQLWASAAAETQQEESGNLQFWKKRQHHGWSQMLSSDLAPVWCCIGHQLLSVWILIAWAWGRCTLYCIYRVTRRYLELELLFIQRYFLQQGGESSIFVVFFTHFHPPSCFYTPGPVRLSLPSFSPLEVRLLQISWLYWKKPSFFIFSSPLPLHTVRLHHVNWGSFSSKLIYSFFFLNQVLKTWHRDKG